MTPKEKAEELYYKFEYGFFGHGIYVEQIKKEATKQAIICVDEILNQDEKAFDLTEREYHFAYWQNVKEELINL